MILVTLPAGIVVSPRVDQPFDPFHNVFDPGETSLKPGISINCQSM